MAGWDRLPFLIAHRGSSSIAPENTLPAFELAIAAGAEVLECDVQMSVDGVAVVIHDPTVDRTTDGRGMVRDLEFETIRSLDAGYADRFGARFAGCAVPRLEELFDLARGKAAVFVEIKPEALADTSGRIEASVVEAARRTSMTDSVGILSFAPRALQAFRDLAPEFPLGLVFRWWRQRRLVEETVAAGARYLVGYAPRLMRQPRIIAEAHGAGLLVGAYVADTQEHVEALLRAGVDGIATNRIGDLLPAFRRAAGA